MDTALRLKIAEGMVPLHFEGYRLNAGFITFLNVDHAGGVAAPLNPALVHTHEHVGPVARLGASRTGIDREVGVGLVEFPREKLFEFEFLDLSGECVKLLRNLTRGLSLGSSIALLECHFLQDLEIPDALL